MRRSGAVVWRENTESIARALAVFREKEKGFQASLNPRRAKALDGRAPEEVGAWSE